MDIFAVVITSGVVAAVVGPIASYAAQRRLAERQSALNYELAAKTRLNQAVGPLRFQLLIASRDVIRRVGGHDAQQWQMDPCGYYGRSSIYRLLRPLAITALIERQIAYADFSLDPDARVLLQFQTACYRMMTGSDPVPEHPDLDWTSQTQHIFRDNLRAAAARLIVEDEDGQQIVMDYGLFEETFSDPTSDIAMRPLAEIFASCNRSLTENGVFWARLVGYSFVCSWFIETVGAELGFTSRRLPVDRMLGQAKDVYVASLGAVAEEMFQATIDEGF